MASIHQDRQINHCLKDATGTAQKEHDSCNFNCNFRPTTETTPHNQSPKKLGTGDYVRGPYNCAKFGANPLMGLLDKWVKYNVIFVSIPFFRELTFRWDPSTDFHAWWLKRRGLAQGCALWGFRWYCSPFWGLNSPKNIFGVVNRLYQAKLNWRNFESFILTKLLHRFQPNFARR